MDTPRTPEDFIIFQCHVFISLGLRRRVQVRRNHEARPLYCKVSDFLRYFNSPLLKNP